MSDLYKKLFPKNNFHIPPEIIRFRSEPKPTFSASVRANKRKIIEFISWVDSLKASDRNACNDVMAGFEKLIRQSKEPPFDGARLIYHALKSCWCAKQYEAKGNPHQPSREKQKQALDSIDDLLHERIRRLPFTLKSRPSLDGAMWLATQIAERNGVVIHSETGHLKQLEQWQVLLEAFIEGLEVYEQSYPFGSDENHRIGCLYYPKGIQFGGAKPEAATMLAFDLTRQFRLYTAKQSDRESLDSIAKTEMHRIGKPNYELVANLVKMTFKKNYSNVTARDLVRQLINSNAGIRYKDWPHE